MIIAAVAMCAMPLCSSAQTSQSAPQLEYPENATTIDSLSILSGYAIAMSMLKNDIPTGIVESESFRKGVQLAFEGDSALLIGYCMGVTVQMMAEKSKEEIGEELDPKKVVQGIMARASAPVQIDTSAIESLLVDMGNRAKLAYEDKLAKTPEAIAAKKAGDEYLARMKKTKKYTVTESGLMYRVITPGEGENFCEFNDIIVNYEGRLVNGKVVEQADSASVYPGGVTDGCGEMLLLMKPGMKVEAIIPGNIAYGLRGNPKRGIGPNETLVFVIETIGFDESGMAVIEDTEEVEDLDDEADE